MNKIARFTAALILASAVALPGCGVHWFPEQGKGGDPSPGPSVTSAISTAAKAAPDGYRESRRLAALDTIAHIDEFRGWADMMDHFQEASKAGREKMADLPWENAVNDFLDVDKADWSPERAKQALQELADGWAPKAAK